MRIYNAADDELNARFWEIARAHHERLTQAEVTIDLQMVMEDAEIPMPCLKHQGYSALAIVSVTPLKRRAQGAADALIEIDRVAFDELGEEEQDAVLDHELTHLVLQVKESGELKRDGIGRPKLKVRLHDHQYGWFNEVAERRQVHSQEVQQYRRLAENVHQTWMAFADHPRAAVTKASRNGAVKKGKSFAEECDDLITSVEKQAGVKFQRNVTIKTPAKGRKISTKRTRPR